MEEAFCTEPGAERESTPLNAYCLHCATGQEQKMAERIALLHPGITALAVLQEKHQSRNGARAITRRVMLPGYVFLFSRAPIPFRSILPMNHVIRFLTYGHEEDFALRVEDLAFAQWVRRHEGMMACSRAVSVGSSLRIIEGPLADHIGTVEKIDRHNRNVCLSISFSGMERMVWMPFRWAEETGSLKLMDVDENVANSTKG